MFTKPNIDKIKNSRQIDKLVQLLKHRNAQTRIEVLAALFDIAFDNNEIVDKMRSALNDKDAKVRNRAALLFARKGDTEVIDNLAEIISKGTVNEQTEVLRILPHYYSKENEKITQILALALKDKKPSVQIEAIKSIGEMEIDTMAFYLLEFANHSVARFRLETVIALGRIKNPIGVDLLIGALTDSSPEVRKTAEESLKKIGTDRALCALKDAPFMLIVKNMNESVSRRLTTVINIGKQKREFGLPLLHKACFDEYKNIRIEAIKSIALLKESSSIPTLMELLSDRYYDVRIEAIKALARFQSEMALHALKGAMNDSNTNVKLEAKKAYAALCSKMNILDNNKN
jgi:HEAT repeat protein